MKASGARLRGFRQCAAGSPGVGRGKRNPGSASVAKVIVGYSQSTGGIISLPPKKMGVNRGFAKPIHLIVTIDHFDGIPSHPRHAPRSRRSTAKRGQYLAFWGVRSC
jgi:hypothetical protein